MLLQHQGKIIISLLLLVCFVECAETTKNPYKRETLTIYPEEVINKEGDSIIAIYFKKENVGFEIYRNKSLISIQPKEFSLINYYRDNFNLRELGVELYSYHCSHCHKWYPDSKQEFNYQKVDSTFFFNFFIDTSSHQSIHLSPVEIISIGYYLKIIGNHPKFSP